MASLADRRGAGRGRQVAGRGLDLRHAAGARHHPAGEQVVLADEGGDERRRRVVVDLGRPRRPAGAARAT